MRQTPTESASEIDKTVRNILERNRVIEARRIVGEYEAYRELKGGGIQKVRVQIWDLGPSSPNARYRWEVWAPEAEVPKPLSTNPAESVHAAGLNVHWNLLDDQARSPQA